MSWTLVPIGDLLLWRADDAPPGCVIAATTRAGGASEPPYASLNLGLSTDDRPAAVAENRRRVLAALGFAPDRLATAGQVHGTRVTHVAAPGLHRDTDGLATTEPGLALAVSGADCLPLLYCAGGAVAAAHAGWRGVVAGMPRAALDTTLALAGAGADAARVWIGPGIGPCCFRVGDDVAAQFPTAAVERRADGAHVDLAAAVRLELEAAGVPAAAITGPPACTSCAADRCFSHRRDRGITGRQWGLAGRFGPANGGRV